MNSYILKVRASTSSQFTEVRPVEQEDGTLALDIMFGPMEVAA